MFSPTPMQRVSIVASQEDIEAVALALGRMAQLHLQGPDVDDAAADSSHWRDLHRALGDRVDRLRELTTQLEIDRNPFSPPPQLHPSQELKDIDHVLQDAERQLETWRKKRRQTQERLSHLQHLEREARLLAQLNIPMSEIREPAYLHWMVGTIPRDILTTLQFSLHQPRKRYPKRGSKQRQRINVFLHADEAAAAAAALHRLDGFQFVEERGENPVRGDHQWKPLARKYTEQTDVIASLMTALEMETPDLPPPAHQNVENDAAEIAADVKAVKKPVRDWQRRFDAARRDLQALKTLHGRLQQLLPLEKPLEALRDAAYLHCTAGRMPAADFETLQMALFLIPSVVLRLHQEGDRVLLLAVTAKAHADLLQKTLSGMRFEQLTWPTALNGHPAQALKQLEKQMRHKKEGMNALKAEQQRLQRQNGARLAALWQRASSNAGLADALSSFRHHGEIYMISGRTSEERLPEVALALENATRGKADIDIMAPGKTDVRAAVEMSTFRIPLTLVSLDAGHEKRLVVAVTTCEHADTLERALNGIFFEPLPLPEELQGLPSSMLPEIRRQIEQARQVLDELQQEREELKRRWKQPLAAMWRQAVAARRVAGAISRSERQKQDYAIGGWIAAPAVPEMKAAVEAASGGRADIVLLTPDVKDPHPPPTKMQNPAFLRPFAYLVRIFGCPGYDEIDPTPLTAMTFMFMYGLMFGDVGHGLMLALLGLTIVKRKEGTIRLLGKVIFTAGISGALFGFLYGSVFGREDILPALWIRPLDNIPQLLTVSVGGGVLLLSTGFLVFVCRAARSRDWGAFFFGTTGLTGLWLYWALVVGGYAAARGWMPFWLLVWLAGLPALLLMMRAPLQRLVRKKRPLLQDGIAVTVARGFFELFEKIISDAGNSLSFLRLGAFAVAHAGLMRVIFALADHGGDIASVLIVVVGTLTVVVFEGLVVGIQAMRLQYYEFFSRFFSGQGIPFEPFTLAEKKR